MAANYRKVGERIQKARTLRGMSMGELANKVHYTPKSIALVESGQAELNVSLLTSLCTVLDITPNDLLEGEYQSTGASRSLEEESLLNELRELLAELKGEADESLVMRDTESVIHEIRDMLREEKSEGTVQPSLRSGTATGTGTSKPKRSNDRAHYF